MKKGYGTFGDHSVPNIDPELTDKEMNKHLFLEGRVEVEDRKNGLAILWRCRVQTRRHR